MASNGATVAGVLLAGGSGTRLGHATNKVYVQVGGRPVLAWSLATLDAHPRVERIVVVARAGDEAHLHGVLGLVAPSTPLQIVTGGRTRSASERAAFDALAPAVDAGEVDWVVVHDGARPFLTLALLDRVIGATMGHGGALPGLLPAHAVYERSTDGTEARRLPTESLRRVQTPQGFAAGPLLEAYRAATEVGFEGVDTAEVVSRFAGLDAVVVRGDPDNIKVTTADDLDAAEDIAARWLSREDR